MSEHKLARKPAPVVVDDDGVTFKSCCTELFRWVRKGIDVAEETPSFLQSCAEDVAQAWEDSAKK